jgi:hypothetical protein
MTRPLHLQLRSASRAADAGYLALGDVAHIATATQSQYRIVGGHMVTLLVDIHGVADYVTLRETLDVDFGTLPRFAADPALTRALIDCGVSQTPILALCCSGRERSDHGQVSWLRTRRSWSAETVAPSVGNNTIE